MEEPALHSAMIRLNLQELHRYMGVVYQAAPYVNVGRGIDVSRSGIVRGLLEYGLTRLDELTASEHLRSRDQMLSACTWWYRSEMPYRQIKIPLHLWQKAEHRPEMPGAPTSAAVSMIVELGLNQIQFEDSAEVSEFWLGHFNAEHLAGLRRGRKRRPATATAPGPEV